MSEQGFSVYGDLRVFGTHGHLQSIRVLELKISFETWFFLFNLDS